MTYDNRCHCPPSLNSHTVALGVRGSLSVDGTPWEMGSGL